MSYYFKSYQSKLGLNFAWRLRELAKKWLTVAFTLKKPTNELLSFLKINLNDYLLKILLSSVTLLLNKNEYGIPPK